jgi:hypothetical protein
MASILNPGNVINYGGMTIPQGYNMGNVQVFTLFGYADVSATATGEITMIIPHPDQNRDNTEGLVVPTGSAIITRGLKVPAVNTDGDAATLVGTDTETIRLGSAVDDADGAILTFSGTTMGGVEDVDVVTINPGSLSGSAETFNLWAEGNISASAGTIRVLGLIQFVQPIDFPSVELISNKTAPTVSYS